MYPPIASSSSFCSFPSERLILGTSILIRKRKKKIERDISFSFDFLSSSATIKIRFHVFWHTGDMNEMIVDEELTSPVSKSRALDRWERPPGRVYPDEEDGNSATDFGYSSGLGRSQESLDQRRYPLRRSLLEDSRRQTSKNGTAWGEDDIARNRDPVEFRDDKETEDDRLFAEFSTLTSNSWKTLPKQLSDAGTTSLRFGFATDRSHGSTASSSSAHSQKG